MKPAAPIRPGAGNSGANVVKTPLEPARLDGLGHSITGNCHAKAAKPPKATLEPAWRDDAASSPAKTPKARPEAPSR